MQQLGFCDWAAQLVQIVEQLARLFQRKRLRFGAAIENFERRSAGIPVAAGDAVKFRIADFGGRLQGPEYYRPSHLQGT